MHEVYLCLDVGGTEIKAAPLDANGKMLSKIQYFPAMACADKKTLLEHFAHIFTSICPADKVPIEIDLAFPGPFDYENGICLLQGLEKYDALYGCNLRHAFAALSGLPQKRIQFINDAAAFALGELTFGSSRLPAFQSARMYHPCGMHSAADIPDEQLLRSPASASDHQEVHQNRSALRFPSMHFPDLRLPSGDFCLQ